MPPSIGASAARPGACAPIKFPVVPFNFSFYEKPDETDIVSAMTRSNYFRLAYLKSGSGPKVRRITPCTLGDCAQRIMLS